MTVTVPPGYTEISHDTDSQDDICWYVWNNDNTIWVVIYPGWTSTDSYVDDNGNVTPCETVRNADGTLTFVTNHFSYYAVVVVSAVNVGLIVGIVIAVCAAAAVAFIVLKKKRG